MLKEIAIFGAGLVAGALGASYAIGYMEEQEIRESIAMEDGDDDCEEENSTEEPQPA